ncbi:MAG TPA: ribosome maturation factor RimM [Blastocatellia bacterium]|nr:ribosome maturation factor RimM [Blastocatellia bacterium]
MPDNPEELISVARIARPQGHRGEVIADLLTDFPERFSKLGSALIKKPNGELVRLQLEVSRMHKGRIVLKFAGYDDMNAAEGLRDARVMITTDQLVKLPADNYYEFDLVDCEVTTTNGQSVGKVTGVQKFGAAPLLVVLSEEREHLIPMVSSICLEIDTAQKRIVIDPPDGLLDL